MQNNRRHCDHRLSHKFDLDVFESWITLRRAIAVSIGMDRELDKIGVVEGFGGSLVFSIVEAVIRRPQLPQFTTERSPIGGQSSPSALSVEIPLIPITVFGIRRGGLQCRRNVLNVVASDRDEPCNPIRPQRGHDAGSTATPIIAREYRTLKI